MLSTRIVTTGFCVICKINRLHVKSQNEKIPVGVEPIPNITNFAEICSSMVVLHCFFFYIYIYILYFINKNTQFKTTQRKENNRTTFHTLLDHKYNVHLNNNNVCVSIYTVVFYCLSTHVLGKHWCCTCHNIATILCYASHNRDQACSFIIIALVALREGSFPNEHWSTVLRTSTKHLRVYNFSLHMCTIICYLSKLRGGIQTCN